MSKKINVNPDHYKVAGRERPGEDVPHERNKRELAMEAKARQDRRRRGERKGAPTANCTRAR